jgi:hypothetical protein
MTRTFVLCLTVITLLAVSGDLWAGGPIRSAGNQQYATQAPTVPKTYPYSSYGHPGPYPIYRESGLYRLGVGGFNMTTAMIATPFRVGDVFLDRCSRPPEYVPGPVNPYRAYCTPEIWVPPWQPAPYCAPPTCPPKIAGRPMAPNFPPLPGSYEPTQTRGPYAANKRGADTRIFARPEGKSPSMSAFW